MKKTKTKRKGGFPTGFGGRNVRKGSMGGTDRQARKPMPSGGYNNPNNADKVLSSLKRSGVGP